MYIWTLILSNCIAYIFELNYVNVELGMKATLLIEIY